MHITLQNCPSFCCIYRRPTFRHRSLEINAHYITKLTFISTLLLYTIQYSFHAIFPGRPWFTHTPESVGITVGEEIILPCSGEGSPTPSVTWWRVDENGENMTEVIPDRRIIIRLVLDFTNSAIGLQTMLHLYCSDEYLVITEARVEDEGFYYCNISSPLDERMSDTIFISVWSEYLLSGKLVWGKVEGGFNIIGLQTVFLFSSSIHHPFPSQRVYCPGRK